MEGSAAFGQRHELGEVLMPTARRRAALLLAAGLLGGSVAYVVPRTVTWAGGAPVLFALAFIAGISALWSP